MSETPSASPGASRRASLMYGVLSQQNTGSMSDSGPLNGRMKEQEYTQPTQSSSWGLMGALSVQVCASHAFVSQEGAICPS